MSDSELNAQVAAASAYEELFVPALFRQWAPRVASAAGIQPGQRVLDVACGTGVLGREALARVRGGAVSGLDANQGMLAVARRAEPGIEWRHGTAEALPYADTSFDAVVSQFGLMFFGDRRQALREMMRVLKPGGRLAVAVWDALERAPAYAAEVALVRRLAGDRAADTLRAPFALGDPREISALATEAGVGSISVASESGVARFPSVRAMVEADILGWLPLMGVALSEVQVGRILREAELALAPYVTPDGTMAFDLSAHILTGTKA